MTSVAENIIDKFGGVTALARALNHKNITTVHGWKQRNTIPSKRMAELLKLAEEKGIDLEPQDFFPSTKANSSHSREVDMT